MKRVRRLELRTERKVDELLVGRWHAAFKGRGMEFEEVRPYVEGDDVRLIDWNVTARAGKPYIKSMREEREMSVMLLVDASPSMRFGSSDRSKWEMVTELAATIGLSAVRNNDRVGLSACGAEGDMRLPSRTGMKHILRIIRELLVLETHQDPSSRSVNDGFLRDAMERISSRRDGRHVVFLISDFREQGFEKPLRVLGRAHDVIPVVVEDPIELRLPAGGLVRLKDSETGRMRWIDLTTSRARRQVQDLIEQHRQYLEVLFTRSATPAVWLNTAEDFMDPLRKFLELRRNVS
ncbi:MAG: DUF58 domain-containing protein [Planctomycetota bacterium]